MATKGFILASCAVFVLSAGAALAGPCDTGRASKDAGSGPTVGSTAPNAHGNYGYRSTSADRHDEPCRR